MKATTLLITSFICISLLGCSNNNMSSMDQQFPFEFEGVVQKAGMTIYMYGTHTITNKDKMYALQGKNVDLDLYINKNVVVKGAKVDGYPIDSGP